MERLLKLVAVSDLYSSSMSCGAEPHSSVTVSYTHLVETGGRISEEMLMAFVAELPDGCRTVFNLYVFEEKSHKMCIRDR